MWLEKRGKLSHKGVKRYQRYFPKGTGPAKKAAAKAKPVAKPASKPAAKKAPVTPAAPPAEQTT